MYICQRCQGKAITRSNEVLGIKEGAPYIEKRVVCDSCGYTIPKDTADKANLLESSCALLEALENCPGEFNYPALIEIELRVAIIKAAQ